MWRHYRDDDKDTPSISIPDNSRTENTGPATVIAGPVLTVDRRPTVSAASYSGPTCRPSTGCLSWADGLLVPPNPLVHVDRRANEERLSINVDSLQLVSDLSYPMVTVCSLGSSQSGLSHFLNQLLALRVRFPSARRPEGSTPGAYVAVVKPAEVPFALAVIDCQGFGRLGTNLATEAALLRLMLLLADVVLLSDSGSEVLRTYPDVKPQSFKILARINRSLTRDTWEFSAELFHQSYEIDAPTDYTFEYQEKHLGILQQRLADWGALVSAMRSPVLPSLWARLIEQAMEPDFDRRQVVRGWAVQEVLAHISRKAAALEGVTQRHRADAAKFFSKHEIEQSLAVVRVLQSVDEQDKRFIYERWWSAYLQLFQATVER